MLSGTNTYTGTTTANEGTLSLAGSSSLPASGALAIGAGAKVSNDAVSGTSFSVGILSLTGGELAATAAPDGNLGNFQLRSNVFVSGSSRSLISADVRLRDWATRDFQVAATGDAGGPDLLVSGRLGHYNGSEGGYVNKTGNGVMKLTGENDTAGMIVTEGKLILENNGIGGMWSTGLTNNSQAELSVTGSNSVTFGGPMKGGGTYTKTGSGTLTLSAVNTYTGNTIILGGILRLGNGGSSSNLADGADVIVAPGVMLDLDYSGTDFIDDSGWMATGCRQVSIPPLSASSPARARSPSVMVRPAGNYAVWSGRGGHNLADAPGGDDDSDGVPNLMEYVLGGNPVQSSSGILPAAATHAGNFVFTFRRVSSSTADTTQTFQYGSDLGAWTDVPIVHGGMVFIVSDTPLTGRTLSHHPAGKYRSPAFRKAQGERYHHSTVNSPYVP